MVSLGVLLALTAGLLAPAQAEPAAPASGGRSTRAAAAADCPVPMPVADVRAGMVGEGLTVVRGKEPQPFRVEVVGVLPDAIVPGRDLIIVEVSDLVGRHVIDQGGGIWAGMSGSPVYVDGKLLGAVSYGFTFSPSGIGGVTPAADMLELLDGSGVPTRTTKAPAGPSRIDLPRSIRRQIAARGEAVPASATMTRLRVPFSVSGLSDERIAQLQAEARAAGMPVIAHAGARRAAPGSTAAMTRPEPGGNFAAALSYGDVTVAGIGTTTAVCGSRAVAFGHPLEYRGPVSYGANDGESLAIIKDDTLGSFKMANVAEPFGTVDQDRFAGVSASLGTVPPATAVTTTIRNGDTGRLRTGTTQVVDPVYLPGLAQYAVVANYDATFDEYGDGRATSSWTVSGKRSGGLPFSVRRSNRWASQDDIAGEPAMEMAMAVDALINNEFEEVTIDEIRYHSWISTTFQQLQITGMAVSVNGGPYASPRALRVKPGATLKVRVTLRPYRSSATRTSVVTVKVPRQARGQGALAVTGGLDLAEGGDEEDLGCLFDEEACSGEEADSLDAVLESITSVAHNNDLRVDLMLGSGGPGGSTARSATVRQPYTVSGERATPIVVQP